MASIELRLEIEDLYTAYAATLDDDDLDAWPDLFTEDCLYQVIPRDNFDRDLPLALIRCESRAMLRDRVTAVRETTMFEPRYVRHLISNIRVSSETDGVIEAQANYAVFETMTDEYTRVFNVGRYLWFAKTAGCCFPKNGVSTTRCWSPIRSSTRSDRQLISD